MIVDRIKKATVKVNIWPAIKFLSKKENRIRLQKKIILAIAKPSLK